MAGVFLANVATTAGYWFDLRRDMRDAERRTSSTIEEVAAVATNAVTRADALAAVLVRHGATGGDSLDEETAAPSRPVLLGVGRTRTARGNGVLYYDTRDGAGNVERHYMWPRRSSEGPGG